MSGDTTQETIAVVDSQKANVIVNGNVTINAGPASADHAHARVAVHRHALHPSQVHVPPVNPAHPPHAKCPVIEKDYFDTKGNHVFTFTEVPTLATATYVQDAKNPRKVTFTLKDQNTTVTTHSEYRGYTATTSDSFDPQNTTLHLLPKSGFPAPGTDFFDIGEYLHSKTGNDTLHCGYESRKIDESVTEAVARQKIQAFAAAHPALAARLSADSAKDNHAQLLPVTVIGGQQADFAMAEQTKSGFVGCPADKRTQGMVVEKLPGH